MRPEFTAKPPRLYSIEFLRGLAALTVVFYHLISLAPVSVIKGPLLWLHYGWVGVTLFLVISGYATSRAFLRLPADSMRSKAYWRSRFFRIYPLYLLTSLAFLLLVDAAAVNGDDATFQILTHLTLTHGLFPSTAGSINGVTWTLTLEICLYVLGYVLLRKNLSNRSLCWVLICAVLISVSYRAWVYCKLEPQVHFSLLLPGAAEGFIAGLLIAKLEHEGVLDRFKRGFLPLVLISISTIVFFLAMMLIDQNASSYWHSWRFPAMAHPVLSLCLSALILGLVMFAKPQLETAEKSLWNRFCRFLGDTSFGVYLWHMIVLTLMLRHSTLTGWLLVTTVLLWTYLLSWLGFHLFEKRFIAMARVGR